MGLRVGHGSQEQSLYTRDVTLKLIGLSELEPRDGCRSDTACPRFKTAWSNSETLFDYATKRREIADIENDMGRPDFWSHADNTQKTVFKLKGLKGIVGPIDELSQSSADLIALIEMAEGDQSMDQEIRQEIERIERDLAKLELKALLNGPNDATDAILSINARDGGTDANDWAEMMLRMYTAWANQHDFKVELLDRSDNEEAGINSATIAIRGPMAYGYLKGEEGIHRLVRISPFNSEGNARPALLPSMLHLKLTIRWKSIFRRKTFARIVSGRRGRGTTR